MTLSNLIDKNKIFLAKIIICLIIILRCDFGIVSTGGLIGNLIVDFVGVIFCAILCKRNLPEFKKSIFNIAIVWVILFSLLQFVYGHFGLIYDTQMYSTRFAILTICPAIIIYEILWHFRDDIIEILGAAGSVAIVSTFVISLFSDYLWEYFFVGEYYRVGATPGGTVIDTGNLYLLMLIPILYIMIIEEKRIRYIFPCIAGVIGILLTGSKSSAIPLILVFAIFVLGKTDDRRILVRNLIILILVAIAGLVCIMTIPALYDVLGSRIEELILYKDSAYDLHTSTGQRMAVWAAFKEHFWENPVFGHGFYAFKSMPYSQLEEYYNNGVLSYRNIQTHMNFLELLFSFGLFGFIVYYWFPALETVFAVKHNNKKDKLICLSYLLSLLFMDLGLDMFYKYMLPYFAYLVVYTILIRNKER